MQQRKVIMHFKDLSHDCSNGKKNKASLVIMSCIQVNVTYMVNCIKYIYVFETAACTKVWFHLSSCLNFRHTGCPVRHSAIWNPAYRSLSAGVVPFRPVSAPLPRHEISISTHRERWEIFHHVLCGAFLLTALASKKWVSWNWTTLIRRWSYLPINCGHIREVAFGAKEKWRHSQ